MLDKDSDNKIKKKNTNKNNNKFIKVLLGLLCVLLISFIGVIAYAQSLMNPDKIYKNVYVQGTNVSDFTKAEATSELTKKFKYPNLILDHEGTKFTQDLDKLGFKYNIAKAVDEAFMIGRDSNFIGNSFNIIKQNMGNEENIELQKTEDYAKLEPFYKDIEKKVNTEPVNANINFSNGNIETTPSKKGYVVDMAKLKQDVKTNISKISQEQALIKIPVKITEPKIKEEQLKSINGIISSYSSNYNPAQVERAYNVSLTAKKVDHQLLMPGEEISFMNTLGDISVSSGFKNAKIIINNEYQDGIGGGVCQVSSTLYNALLMGGVDISQRTNHSFPIGYIPTGRDATVAIGGPDLKYVNNYPFPVLIKTYAGGGTMVAEIYGDTTRAKRYDVVSEITSTIPPNVVYKNDPSLPQGKEVVEDFGHTGYTSVTYKISNGQKQIVSQDSYATTPKIILKGTGPAVAPAKPATTPNNTTQNNNAQKPAPQASPVF